MRSWGWEPSAGARSWPAYRAISSSWTRYTIHAYLNLWSLPGLCMSVSTGKVKNCFTRQLGSSAPSQVLRRMQYTQLHPIEMHCPALYCTALNWTELHCTTLHFTIMHWTALQCSALNWHNLHGPTQHHIAHPSASQGQLPANHHWHPYSCLLHQADSTSWQQMSSCFLTQAWPMLHLLPL